MHIKSLLCNILSELSLTWNDVYEICAKSIFGENTDLCALWVFWCVLVSRPVCALTHSQLRGNIAYIHTYIHTYYCIVSIYLYSSFSLESPSARASLLASNPSTSLWLLKTCLFSWSYSNQKCLCLPMAVEGRYINTSIQYNTIALLAVHTNQKRFRTPVRETHLRTCIHTYVYNYIFVRKDF